MSFALTFFCRWQMKVLMMATITIWSFVNVCEWGCWALKEAPSLPMLQLLRPMLLQIKSDRTAFVVQKVHLEVLIAVLSVFVWVKGWCAPIFPFFFIQMMRIKASINSFPATTYSMMDEKARSLLPSSTYASLIDANRATLRKISGLSMFDVQRPPQKPKEPKEPAKKKSEPKIYEIGSDEDDSKKTQKPSKRSKGLLEVKSDDLD